MEVPVTEPMPAVWLMPVGWPEAPGAFEGGGSMASARTRARSFMTRRRRPGWTAT